MRKLLKFGTACAIFVLAMASSAYGNWAEYEEVIQSLMMDGIKLFVVADMHLQTGPVEAAARLIPRGRIPPTNNSFISSASGIWRIWPFTGEGMTFWYEMAHQSAASEANYRQKNQIYQSWSSDPNADRNHIIEIMRRSQSDLVDRFIRSDVRLDLVGGFANRNFGSDLRRAMNATDLRVVFMGFEHIFGQRFPAGLASQFQAMLGKAYDPNMITDSFDFLNKIERQNLPAIVVVHEHTFLHPTLRQPADLQAAQLTFDAYKRNHTRLSIGLNETNGNQASPHRIYLLATPSARDALTNAHNRINNHTITNPIGGMTGINRKLEL